MYEQINYLKGGLRQLIDKGVPPLKPRDICRRDLIHVVDCPGEELGQRSQAALHHVTVNGVPACTVINIVPLFTT